MLFATHMRLSDLQGMLLANSMEFQVEPFWWFLAGGNKNPFQSLTNNILNLFDRSRIAVSFVGTPVELRTGCDKILAFAISCNVNLERALWAKYPGYCPYCGCRPCRCGLEKSAPHVRQNTFLQVPAMSLEQYQNMFRDIYPVGRHNLWQILDKVEEEAEEAYRALAFQIGTGKRLELNEEFADWVAWIFQVANTLGIDLGGMC